MSKRDEKIALYTKALESIGKKVNDELLLAAVKSCGPSIYLKDAETVAGSDPVELARVRDNFMKKKLGLTDSDEKLDAEIAKVIEQIGKSNRNKYRAVFHYLLVENLGLVSKFV